MNIAERLAAPNIVASWVPFCTVSRVPNQMVFALQTVQRSFGVKTIMAIFGFGAVDGFKQWLTTPDGKFDRCLFHWGESRELS
jgi:hypothetical protein